jgi:CDP-diacylglycerol---serine O-phosphatidyltransferase
MRGRLRSRRLAGAGFGAAERGAVAAGRRGPLRQKVQARGIFLLPSLLTTGNLFCGFFAMLLTVESRYFEASLAIFVAMVMDMLDGRVARLMKATSQFGVEFDSLADVVSFCVAPGFLIYSFALAGLGRPAWFAAFLFVICGALRLARFNVYTGVVDRRFFVGLPTPAAAGVLVSTVLLLYREEPPRWVLVAIAVGTYLTALLMVSTFRYWSFKEIDFARRRPAQTLLVVVLSVMIVATNHELFPFLLFGIYAISGPVRSLIIMGRATATPHGELGTKEPS